jgi:hypothetical protein
MAKFLFQPDPINGIEIKSIKIDRTMKDIKILERVQGENIG